MYDLKKYMRYSRFILYSYVVNALNQGKYNFNSIYCLGLKGKPKPKNGIHMGILKIAQCILI